MTEVLRSADPQTIEAAVGRMARGVHNLGELVWQLRTSIDVCRRAGGVPAVDVFEVVQKLGRERLEEFRDALDSLTVPVTRGCDFGCGPDSARDPRLAVPVMGSEAQTELMGGGHA